MTENNTLYRISFGRNSHYFTTKDLVGFLATFEQNNIEYFGTFNVEKITDNVIVDDNVTLRKQYEKASESLLKDILKEDELFEDSCEDPYEEDLRF